MTPTLCRTRSSTSGPASPHCCRGTRPQRRRSSSHQRHPLGGCASSSTSTCSARRSTPRSTLPTCVHRSPLTLSASVTTPPKPYCVWHLRDSTPSQRRAPLPVDVSTGPTQISEVLKRRNAVTEFPDASDRMFRALVEPRARATARSNRKNVSACNVVVEWYGYAIDLLSPAEIDRHAAHNKVKHGLAVRAVGHEGHVFGEGPRR